MFVAEVVEPTPPASAAAVAMLPIELERLLASAAVDPAERPAFTLALLQSDVYVLGTIDPPPVAGVAQADSTAQLVALTDDDGPVTPFFTSESMIHRTLAGRPGTDPHYLRLACRSLLDLTRGSRLVLNPDGPYAKIYLPAEIEALATGHEPGIKTEVVETERQVFVGEAAHIPAELPVVLARHFAQRPTVRAAHLGWIAHSDGQVGYLMVVIADDRDAAMSGFGSLHIGEFTEGATLDVVVEAPDSDRHMLSEVPAFYSRQPLADA